MLLVDLIQSIVNTAVYTCGEPNDYCPLCYDQGAICPATTMTSIAAAFATQGYWVQADLLDMLTFSSMSAVAPLLYVCAAIAGLLGVALGQPPKIYMWFFLGPAFYGWLIDTRQEVTGVQWQVGMNQQDQREVWKQAEVGLLNTNMARRMEEWGDGHYISSVEPPSNVNVATFFIWYDSLLSSVINGLVHWTGAYLQRDNADGFLESNVGFEDWVDASAEQEDRWFLLSNLKWDILENITSAKLTNPMTRDAFATFIGGLCGEQLTKAIDTGAFSSAATADGDNLPATVFKRGASADGFNDPDNSMTLLAKKLREYEVEYADNLRKLFTPVDDRLFYQGPTMNGGSLGYATPVGSFEGSINWDGVKSDWLRGTSDHTRDTVRCDTYLYLMLLAFRWEAGHIFSQIVANSPELSAFEEGRTDLDAQAKKLVRNIFYGWNIKINRISGDPLSGSIPGERQYRSFLMDLIVVHLIKNEFALVKQPADVRYTGTYLSKNFTDVQQRTVGQKNKFGEMYAWARLMPYLQGVLLYYLAIGYPFACLLMVIPGWHKTLFTWMSFWAWVKIWDVGFALVISIERSVWAMIGNSSQAAGLHDRVVEMQQWGGVLANPPDDACGSTVCTVWDVVLTSTGSTAMQETFNYINMLKNFRIFDRAMTIGPSLDLDLSNSYYIFIMSALYFAVPAVTGQLVLGAKAGAASMFTSAVSQVAGEAGKAAGSGFSADATARMKANMASIGQASQGAYLQKSGLAADALAMGNAQTEHGVAGSLADAKGKGIGHMLTTASNANQAVSAWSGALGQRISAAGQKLGNNQQALDGATSLTGPRSGPNAGAPGGLNKFGGVAGDALKMATGGFYSNESLMGGVANSRVAANANYGYLQASNRANAAQAGLGVQSFGNSALSSGYGRGSNLKSQQAAYGADMARWNAQNQMASQLSGVAAGMGISSDALSQGTKPAGEGYWMSGGAGAEAKAQADRFGWGGSFFSQVGAMTNDLNSQYGQGAVSAASELPSYSSVVGAVDSQLGQMQKDGSAFSPAKSVDQILAASELGRNYAEKVGFKETVSENSGGWATGGSGSGIGGDYVSGALGSGSRGNGSGGE